LAHSRACAEQRERRGDERTAHENDEGADGRGRNDSATEMEAETCLVARAVGLSDKAGGGHAQKAKGPEDSVEKNAAHGHAAQCGSSRQMAGEHRVNRREQRLGEVGEDKRNRQQKNPPVPGVH